jgi:hypothetical protein
VRWELTLRAVGKDSAGLGPSSWVHRPGSIVGPGRGGCGERGPRAAALVAVAAWPAGQAEEAGAPRPLMDGQRPNALIAAVRDGDGLEVRRILRGYGGRRVDINQLDSFGNTALHWAVMNDKADIVQLLIEGGAKVNVVNEEAQTPLLRACRLGRHEAVDMLLDADAQATVTDREGGSPLMKAAYGGLADIIEKLIQRGGQHALLDQNKRTALHHAARAGHADAIRVLVRACAASR